MHLAIRSAEELESSRPVRALLFSNAPTDIKDKNGYIPLDHLEEVNSITLKNDLESYLKQKRRLCDCLMLSRPFRKVERSNKMVILFAVLVLGAQVPLIFYLFPGK